jgi:hypothetical protein
MNGWILTYLPSYAIGRKLNLAPFPLFSRERGCQDVIGSNPSVFLDKMIFKERFDFSNADANVMAEKIIFQIYFEKKIDNLLKVPPTKHFWVSDIFNQYQATGIAETCLIQ